MTTDFSTIKDLCRFAHTEKLPICPIANSRCKYDICPILKNQKEFEEKNSKFDIDKVRDKLSDLDRAIVEIQSAYEIIDAINVDKEVDKKLSKIDLAIRNIEGVYDEINCLIN